MNENNDITRFLDAQVQAWSGYNVALGEITSGRKEAEAYLSHPVLGARLREITEPLLKHADKSAVRIFGGIDALKVMSCMTLVDCISPNDIFGDVLDSFYNVERDPNSVI